jgi:signal transduction histidine kinase
LSVARAIARMHHGEIKITSKETGGTTVRVAIPIGEIENPDERPSSDD